MGSLEYSRLIDVSSIVVTASQFYQICIGIVLTGSINLSIYEHSPATRRAQGKSFADDKEIGKTKQFSSSKKYSYSEPRLCGS